MAFARGQCQGYVHSVFALLLALGQDEFQQARLFWKSGQTKERFKDNALTPIVGMTTL